MTEIYLELITLIVVHIPLYKIYLNGIHLLSSTANLAHSVWNRAESAVLLSRWIPLRYLYDFENYIFEIRTLQG